MEFLDLYSFFLKYYLLIELCAFSRMLNKIEHETKEVNYLLQKNSEVFKYTMFCPYYPVISLCHLP